MFFFWYSSKEISASRFEKKIVSSVTAFGALAFHDVKLFLFGGALFSQDDFLCDHKQDWKHPLANCRKKRNTPKINGPTSERIYLLYISTQRSRWVRVPIAAGVAISGKLAYSLRALFPWQIPYSGEVFFWKANVSINIIVGYNSNFEKKIAPARQKKNDWRTICYSWMLFGFNGDEFLSRHRKIWKFLVDKCRDFYLKSLEILYHHMKRHKGK